ncbi:helix-turn-helix domain-containing protein [Faunimonas pinastri]|uniref:helix-turn-helix domain-containing protein n=1 Tax=Faunimonas pinastri TaxID=1855383 RepID=UPI003D16DD29
MLRHRAAASLSSPIDVSTGGRSGSEGAPRLGERAKWVDGYIGARLRAYRESSGLTREELAEDVGIAVCRLIECEDGSARAGAALLVRMAEAFRINPDRFFPPSEPLRSELPDLPVPRQKERSALRGETSRASAAISQGLKRTH